jgi:hypothetical protein
MADVLAITAGVHFNICSDALRSFRKMSKRAAIAKRGQSAARGRPSIMALLDLLGRRWSLQII